MFDRFHIQSGPRSISTNVKVEEHRAPTDESVRLLIEMQAAAEKNRIATLHLEDNAFVGRVEFHQDHSTMDTVASAIFSINGRRLTASAHLNGLAAPTDRALILKLRERMAEVIANEVLAGMAEGLRWQP